MKQIIALLFSYSIIVIFESDNMRCYGMRRGPHHPRGEMVKRETKTKLDEHLVHEEKQLDEELNEMGVNVNESALTEEERHFYYFKIHDNDNNNALDGLEMLYAALHHEHSVLQDNGDKNELTTNDPETELEHIIEVIDGFLDLADTDNDGFLYYPEYMKAINDNKVD